MKKYKQTRIRQKLRMWFRAPSQDRQPAYKLAKELEYSTLKHACPALLRLAKIEPEKRDESIRAEAGKHKDLSTAMLKSLLEAIKGEEVEVLPERPEIVFVDDTTGIVDYAERVIQIGMIFERGLQSSKVDQELSELGQNLTKNLSLLQVKTMENMLYVAALVFLAGKVNEVGANDDGARLMEAVCYPFLRLYRMPESHASISRMRKGFLKLAEALTSDNPPQDPYLPEFSEWWKALIRVISDKFKIGCDAFSDHAGLIQKIPGMSTFPVGEAMDKKEIPAKKEEVISVIEKRLKAFEESTPDRQMASMKSALKKLSGEIEFLSKIKSSATVERQEKLKKISNLVKEIQETDYLIENYLSDEKPTI